MKKITAIILSIVLMCSAITVAATDEATEAAEGKNDAVISEYTHTFVDVKGHWAEDEIERAFSNKMVNGDPDGSFRPDDGISRAEFLKMLVAIICERAEVIIPEEMADGIHWASKYYNFAIQAIYRPLDEDSAVDGIIPGKMSAEDFDKPIGRWEMAYIVSSAIRNVCGVEGRPAEKAFNDKETVDAEYSLTVAENINNTYNLGVMKGDENGNINADQGGTRAEAVTIMNRVDDIMLEIIRIAEEAEATAKKQQEDEMKKLEESLKTYEVIPEGHPVVTVEMENGKKFKIELYPEYAPQTVANFVALVESGFYDGVGFHRVVEGFMAQGGDPKGDGTGGSENTIVGEFSANGFQTNALSHTRGVVSMARSNMPNSASSQFFICYDDASFLDGNYAAFGKVIEGMEVVDAFLEIERSANMMGEMATPVNPIIMKKVTVKK